MDRSHNDDIGFLPAIAVGTLLVFYLVWAALHDIARGEADCTLEYAMLVLSIPAFTFLYRMALRVLTPTARAAWLGGTGLLVLLFDFAAVQVTRHPKYPADPLTGSLFLIAGVPVLVLIGYHLFRLNRRHS